MPGSQRPQVVMPPAPRGYLGGDGGAAASGGPIGYPSQYQLGSRGPITPMPGSMVKAVRLMYAGAAYALIYAIGFVVVVSGYVSRHPDSAIARAGAAATSAPFIVASLVEIALWLWIARACRNRRKWARVTGTVLFGLHTLIVLGVAGNSHAVGGPAKILTLIGWLIACGAVVFLWQRPSSAFFSAPDPMNRAAVSRG
jgi:peptidoglycan/LPS O-acetylase OafA/YrhL